MGYIYRIQWSYEDNKRYETDVNYKRLVDYEDDWVNDRFEIYPTSNIYSFLLKSMAGFGIVIGDLNLKEMGFNGFINIR